MNAQTSTPVSPPPRRKPLGAPARVAIALALAALVVAAVFAVGRARAMEQLMALAAESARVYGNLEQAHPFDPSASGADDLERWGAAVDVRRAALGALDAESRVALESLAAGLPLGGGGLTRQALEFRSAIGKYVEAQTAALESEKMSLGEYRWRMSRILLDSLKRPDAPDSLHWRALEGVRAAMESGENLSVPGPGEVIAALETFHNGTPAPPPVVFRDGQEAGAVVDWMTVATLWTHPLRDLENKRGAFEKQ